MAWDATLTSGPFEQLLDDLLLAVRACRITPVRLTVRGGAEHVRIAVAGTPGHDDHAVASQAHLDRVRDVAATLGGRVSGAWATGDGLVVLVPRR